MRSRNWFGCGLALESVLARFIDLGWGFGLDVW